LNEQGITIVMVTHELDIARTPSATSSCATALVVGDTPVSGAALCQDELRRLAEGAAGRAT
jgi:ABC-type arginine transport system ATPase subunit